MVTLMTPGNHDGMICAALAVQAVDTITVATFS